MNCCLINIFREPAMPFVLFTYSDIAIFFIMNFIIIVFIKAQLINKTFLPKLLLAVLWIIVIPAISSNIEIYNVHNKFENVDGFNLWYVNLKYPVWWFIGLINTLLYRLINFF
jgi:hypothetical protein